MKYIIVVIILLSSSFLYADTKVGIFSKDQKKFMIFVEKLKHLQNKNFSYEFNLIKKDYSYSNYKNILLQKKYPLVVLIDNKVLNFHKKYNAEQKPVNAVSVMALNIGNELQNFKHIAGIRYESPVFTLVNDYQFIFKMKLKKVLTVYRKSEFNQQIEFSKKNLKLIGIELQALDLSNGGESLEEGIKKSLKIFKNTEYDAIWLPLDSEILTPYFFKNYWKPFSQSTNKPILVQEETLARPSLNFATFAISANLVDLADQTNQVVESIIVNNVKISEIKIEETISVNKYLNNKKSNELQLVPRSGQDIHVLK